MRGPGPLNKPLRIEKVNAKYFAFLYPAPPWVLVHFTAASSVCVHFLLIQYSVLLLSQLQFPINEMV